MIFWTDSHGIRYQFGCLGSTCNRYRDLIINHILMIMNMNTIEKIGGIKKYQKFSNNK